MDSSLNWWVSAGVLVARSGAEVERDNGDAVGEVLEVFAGAGEAVVVVQIREGREEAHGRALAVSNDESLLAAAFDLEHLDDGAGASNGIDEEFLVDRLGVFGSLLQEELVTDDLNVGLLGVGVRVGELALVDKVATQLLLAVVWQWAGGAEGLDTEAVGSRGSVDVLFVDTLFVAGAVGGSNAGPAGVDVDGVVLGLLVESDL